MFYIPVVTLYCDHRRRRTRNCTCSVPDQDDRMVWQMAEKKLVGEVTNYFGKIGVAAIKLVEPIKVGDRVRFEGATTNFEQQVASMQIDRKPIESAEPGQEIAIKVMERVRPHDKVYLV